MVINSKKCLCQALFRRIPSCPFCTASFSWENHKTNKNYFFKNTETVRAIMCGKNILDLAVGWCDITVRPAQAGMITM